MFGGVPRKIVIAVRDVVVRGAWYYRDVYGLEVSVQGRVRRRRVGEYWWRGSRELSGALLGEH